MINDLLVEQMRGKMSSQWYYVHLAREKKRAADRLPVTGSICSIILRSPQLWFHAEREP